MNIKTNDLVTLVMSDDNKVLFIRPASEVPCIDDESTIYKVNTVNGSRLIMRDVKTGQLLVLDDVKYNGEEVFTILVDGEETVEGVIEEVLQKVKRRTHSMHENLLIEIAEKMDGMAFSDPVAWEIYHTQYVAIKTLVNESLKAI